MNTLRRSRVRAGLLSGAAAALVWCGTGANPAHAVPGAEAQQAAAPQAGGKRTRQQISEDIQTVGQELAPVFSSTQDLFDARKREAAAPKAIPALRKMVALLDELQATKPVGVAEGQEKAQLLALLSAMGDPEAAATLKKMAASPSAAEAATGRSAQLVVRWMQSGTDAAAQQKIVEDFQALAKQYPSEDAVAAAAIMLAGTTKPEARELRQQIRGTVQKTLKGPKVQAVVQQLEQTAAKLEAAAALKALEGKPLVIEGVGANGSPVSTAAWKGKVVLVDFWATWCAPCREALPKVKQVYAQYHDQGLEVIGVSCDNKPEALAKFLSQNKDMPWPQLFDASKPGWHAVAQQYNINQIPAMFLIDRKGVVRSAEARDTFEKLIPELLKEKP